MKPLDLSKYKKDASKNLGISLGFHDPATWISTGNYALNYRISSDFFKGIPLGKVTILAGEPGSGKSYIAACIMREAQKKGVYCFVVDTENALDETWLQAVGVDTSEDKMYKLGVASVDDTALEISRAMKSYVDQYRDVPPEERQRVLFVIDSLSMLLSKTENEQFQKGELKGDMGRLQRQLKALIKNCVHMFAQWDVGMLCTAHTYASQDMFDTDDRISGGVGIVYTASIVVGLKKWKLKLDEDGNKTKDVKGIRTTIKVMKSRYAKPFETLDLHIPYATGLSPYSGLIDMFKDRNVLESDGNKLKYVATDGSEHKYARKEIGAELLDRIMREWRDTAPPEGVGPADDAEDEDEQ